MLIMNEQHWIKTLDKDAHQHWTMMVYTSLGHPGGGGWQ